MLAHCQNIVVSIGEWIREMSYTHAYTNTYHTYTLYVIHTHTAKEKEEGKNIWHFHIYNNY